MRYGRSIGMRWAACTTATFADGLPAAIATATRKVPELIAVRAMSTPCCHRCLLKQMSACFSWVLWL